MPQIAFRIRHLSHTGFGQTAIFVPSEPSELPFLYHPGPGLDAVSGLPPGRPVSP